MYNILYITRAVHSMEKDANHYRRQKNKIIFTEGKHAKTVALTTGGLIRKTYPTSRLDIFNHEVAALKKLQACKFVPRLHFVDVPKSTIYMSYCGTPISNLSKWKTKIKKYDMIMQRKYGIFHNDIRLGNICVKDGQLFFIDFGWARTFKGLSGYGKGKIGDLENACMAGAASVTSAAGNLSRACIAGAASIRQNAIVETTNAPPNVNKRLLELLRKVYVTCEIGDTKLATDIRDILQLEGFPL